MSKPAERHSPGAGAELPDALTKHLDWLADAVVKGAGQLPPGYNRGNIRSMLCGMARRSLNANGPDLPPDTFINSSA
ncbi:hypothetical protein BDHH15_13520 [Bradyrhizobium diazoefficiens]|uniref:Uncharacterized protein n=1 Tax=Bradyrhizobium diazoefficiens TaxID=1355477 RepID=A0A809YCK2_9BRAD|nr:hypothetical protein H12S4_13590 [Bradyrhizobium diazoefficiens]BCA18137.1 hypothetical protein BDHH15_13520 [Bradyrhizobium diazoefficiens]BCE36320.1 hypothetical protein XF3B_13510 [Bradyrhizobium diazoefficiens]BCF49712.1 hypothetical protein XF17B_13500 [Bradyrhizobium diazoefficiens]